MHRTLVQVVKVRMSDLVPGDIINRNADESKGWFQVRELQPLPNGAVAVIAVYEKDSINSAPNDLVGLQVHKVVDLPEPATPEVPTSPYAAAPDEPEAPEGEEPPREENRPAA